METFSDCIAFMTPHTTPMLDFNEVISALATPTTTLSLVKTKKTKTIRFVCSNSPRCGLGKIYMSDGN